MKTDYEKVFAEKGMRERGSVADSITLAEGEYIVGVLTEIRTNVGPNASNMYVIEDEKDGVLKAIWGKTVLDARISHDMIGKEIGIVYKGKTVGKNNREYSDYGVYEMPNAELDARDGAPEQDIMPI